MKRFVFALIAVVILVTTNQVSAFESTSAKRDFESRIDAVLTEKVDNVYSTDQKITLYSKVLYKALANSSEIVSGLTEEEINEAKNTTRYQAYLIVNELVYDRMKELLSDSDDQGILVENYDEYLMNWVEYADISFDTQGVIAVLDNTTCSVIMPWDPCPDDKLQVYSNVVLVDFHQSNQIKRTIVHGLPWISLECVMSPKAIPSTYYQGEWLVSVDFNGLYIPPEHWLGAMWDCAWWAKEFSIQ